MTENQKTVIPGRLESFVTRFRHLDLFSGIGGFSLAARWAYGDEHKPIAFCEIDKYCQKVLKKHWPDVPIFEDIRSLDGRQFRDVDFVSGGFPCQPYSTAGEQRGAADDRALWPEMLRVISGVRPRWVIGENVPGIINMGLDEVLAGLESCGYTCETLSIPACSLGAWHERERIWIVANSDGRRWNSQSLRCTRAPKRDCATNVDSADAEDGGEKAWLVEPGMERVVYGIPRRMDKIRVKMLGNAIVPQVAYQLLKAIKAIDGRTDDEQTDV